jgi:hypothetical protein
MNNSFLPILHELAAKGLIKKSAKRNDDDSGWASRSNYWHKTTIEAGDVKLIAALAEEGLTLEEYNLTFATTPDERCKDCKVLCRRLSAPTQARSLAVTH